MEKKTWSLLLFKRKEKVDKKRNKLKKNSRLNLFAGDVRCSNMSLLVMKETKKKIIGAVNLLAQNFNKN